MKTYGSFFFLAGLDGGGGGVLGVTLGCSVFGRDMEGRDREGSFGSSFLGGGGVTTLGFSGVLAGTLGGTFGKDILGISNVGDCFCGLGSACCLGGVGFFSGSGILGNDNEGRDSLASGGGRNDFFGSVGKVSTGGGFGISALGWDLTPNVSENFSIQVIFKKQTLDVTNNASTTNS